MPTRQKTRPNRRSRIKRWWHRQISYRYWTETIPLDWSEPGAGAYRAEHHELRWHGRTTHWTLEHRCLNQPAIITWNSEHLAFWFGVRTVQSGRQSDGQDVDLDVYTLKSRWLGTHTYCD